LQERECERLGSSRTLSTNVRLIDATNRDLSAMVDKGSFRSDLLFRLNVFPVDLPPLRDRREDIPLLVRRFVEEFSRRRNKTVETISPVTMVALCRHPWPGNIRELQNVIKRAVTLSRGLRRCNRRSLAPRIKTNYVHHPHEEAWRRSQSGVG
jgi:formate hydrogenlyase transcriptional activator